MSTHPGPVVVLARKDYGARRKRWLVERAKGIGGSDAPAVMGLVPTWATPLRIYLDKIHPDLSDAMSERMVWGNRLEHPIAVECGKREKLKILPSPGLLAHPRRAWQLATLDRLAWDGEERVPLEVKTTDKANAKKWPADGSPPDHVVVQVQHQLEVCGAPYAYLACLVGGNDYRFWRIERDEQLIADMVLAEAQLWQCVQERRPPDPIPVHDDLTLSRLAPADPDARLVADESLLDVISQIETLREHSEEINEQIAQLLTLVRQRMGSAVELVSKAGDTLATYRAHTRRQFVLAALRRDHPEIYTQYAVEQTVRPLRVFGRDEDADR